ncbi:interleukin-18 receptor accessory protein isoform X2 [Stegastes partitus]|uniref:Interleukin 18 receptor accessory protein n=1 Tax=Stegastes partitus TaxID=144197 RepID=A0A3B5AHL9_9TELE|nr:PREDICTED: interleukin-18 receptor accessory protein isoform X2 [Stegastes partitus]
MPTEYILYLFIFPSLSVGCHPGKKTAQQQDATRLHYRAVEGETFMLPCINSSPTVWSRTGEGGEEYKGHSFDCGKAFLAEAKHSGKYTDLTSGSKLIFHLQVEKLSVGCYQPGEKSHVTLRLTAGGKLTCPGLKCSNNTDVLWYKGDKTKSCVDNGELQFKPVRERDGGVYFCDRRLREENITWTLRRAVSVTVTPRSSPSSPPTILNNSEPEEVELGLPYNLTCKVSFEYEEGFSPKVLWYMNYNGNTENTTLLPSEELHPQREILEELKIIQVSIIKKVTPQHLNHTYTCSTSNAVGNSSITIKLKRRNKAKWPCLVGHAVVSFLVVAGLGGIVHLKRLELEIIYRSYFQYGKHDTEKKQFDVFLSYAWSPLLADVTKSWTLSSRSGSFKNEEACQSITELFSTDDGEATQRPLEVLLPKVLEDQWGYRLCLLDRDMLPGGAYTNDVVLAIERSRMLICVLSADYLTNSNAVFVLESGIQALLQKRALKLLLIWTSGASGSLMEADPPLPTLVRKALRVLPSLKWSSSKPARSKSNFWGSLRKAMPNIDSEAGFSHAAPMIKLC